MAWYHSKGFNYFRNLWIGVGAGFIIIGALFKILHWKGANEILMFSMIMEASIFFLQGLLPPHKEYYWEKLYPGLDDHNSKIQKLTSGAAPVDNVTNELNKQLKDNGVDGNLIKRLGGHLGALGENLASLTDVTSTTGATSEFSKNAKAAAASLGKVKLAYDKAAGVAGELEVATEHTRKYQEQVSAVSKNLAALNAVYELELQDTNNHLKAMNKFYGNLTNAIENLNESVEDTKKYKTQMAGLAKNLSSLNGVYGNMLSAMSMGAKGK